MCDNYKLEGKHRPIKKKKNNLEYHNLFNDVLLYNIKLNKAANRSIKNMIIQRNPGGSESM